jgi:epoxyqueuosine reductase QueG
VVFIQEVMAMLVRQASAEKAIEDVVDKLQVDAVGIAAVDDWEQTPLGEAARRILPGAQSILVVAMEIFPEVLTHSTPQKLVGEASLRDILAPHLTYLDGRLTKGVYDFCQESRRQGLRAVPLPGGGCPVDPKYLSAVFSFKHAAQAAGLGVIGKSSLLIHPQYGPRVRLACALSEARLAPTKSQPNTVCVDCGLCLEVCPASALDEPSAGAPYSINKFACSAYRGGAGACSECMRVCPLGE